jgi:L-ascorbate metabolism protein UlaG (beta-lactamase superfamily)
MFDNIFRINHACFRIEGEIMIYTDPFHIPHGLPKADLILISHDHFDHCSPEDIEKIAQPNTTFLATENCKDKLNGDVKIVQPGSELDVKGISVKVVKAYNTNKHFHPEEAGHVGYVFTVDGVKIYFAGDTDFIDEMKDIECDVALLPVSGTYVMTAEEAVEAANQIKPQAVIPMHYGDIVGSQDDAKKFRNLYQGQTVIK